MHLQKWPYQMVKLIKCKIIEEDGHEIHTSDSKTMTQWNNDIREQAKQA